MPIAIAFVAGNFIHRTTTKPEERLTKSQESQVLSIQFSQPQVPVVRFPRDIYPEIKISEITLPQIQVQENQHLTIITIPTNLLFECGKHQIHEKAKQVLNQVSQAINNRYPGSWLQILGHADSRRTQKENLQLSEERATAVQQWLSEKVRLNVSAITKEGYGATQPIVSNMKFDCFNNPTGRQKNRRIEIVIQKLNNQL
ncbi:hypothetical protein NUACC21_71760 [Scytonema sp. NUACC21]